MLLRLALLIILLIPGAAITAAQRTVKASDARIAAAAGPETVAYIVVENGTMYDIYLTSVETDAAQAVELLQTTNGKPSVVKEIPIPAFDRLAMTAEGVHLKFTGLKKPLKPGDRVALIIGIDNGDRLTVDATVK